jgi:two-component system capsular synthesis response regulator RcsB
LFQYAQSNGLLNLSSHAPDEGLGSEVTP